MALAKTKEMVSLLTCLLFSVLLCIASVSGGSLEEPSLLFQNQRNITAESGQNVTLPCKAPDGKSVAVVQWSRADLGSDYVLLYRNEQIDQEHQHPSFRNRVDLQDRLMENGDVSLVLRNVTTDDGGAYYCQMFLQVPDSGTETFFINLVVLPPPPPGEPVGWATYEYVALGVVPWYLLVGLLVTGFYIFMKINQKCKKIPSEDQLKHDLMDQNGTSELSLSEG